MMDLVSRDHIEVSFKEGKWWIADLFSSNGTYVDGKKIDHLIISDPIKLELGKNGPIVNIDLISESESGNARLSTAEGSLTSYIQRYFKEEGNNPNAGDHTRMIQQAFKVIKKKQSNKYLIIISSVVFVCLIVAAYAVYQHIKAGEQKELAESIFYEMKGIEVQLSKLATVVQKTR